MKQMQLEPENPILKKEIYKAIDTELEGLFACPDYDDVRFGIDYSKEKETLMFSFRIPNFAELFAIAGEYFLNKHYPQFKREVQTELGYDLTISRKIDFFQPIPKFKNPTPEQEAQKKQVMESNIKALQDFSASLARFRVNFLSAPFEQVFDKVKSDQQADKFTYTIKNGDRVWCISDKESATFFFGLSFADSVDKSIAKLMLDEFAESKRHVKNPPSITRVLEDQKFSYPQVLLEGFPELKNRNETFLNGLISLTFFKTFHMKGETDDICNFLATFRQYIHYHVSASKSYLHCRLMKNIATNLKGLKSSQIEQEEEKNFRTMRDEMISSLAGQEEAQRMILKK